MSQSVLPVLSEWRFNVIRVKRFEWKDDGNTDGQEERNVDGVLLVVGKVEQSEQRRVEESLICLLWCRSRQSQWQTQLILLQLLKTLFQRTHRLFDPFRDLKMAINPVYV